MPTAHQKPFCCWDKAFDSTAEGSARTVPHSEPSQLVEGFGR